MSGKLIKMHVFLVFEPFLLSKRSRVGVVVPRPQVKVKMAGKIDAFVRIGVY